MHPLAGLVVEYLVVGSTSVVWILIALSAFDKLPTGVPEPVLVALAPSIYVLGMLSDRLGRFLIENKKKKVEQEVLKKEGCSEGVSTQVVSACLVVHLPRLAEQLEVRRTRDRVSRGALANVPFLTIAVIVWMVSMNSWFGAGIAGIVGILLYLGVYSMWRRFQKLSARYELICDTRLKEHFASRGSRTNSSETV